MKNTQTTEQTDTALVVQRLSLVPEGAQESALAIVDAFALAAPEFTEGSEKLIEAAASFEVTDQTSAQVADEIQDTLKNEIREWEARRLSVTRPIDDVKTYITSLIKDGIENRRQAILRYQQKISDHRRRVYEEEQRAQREAERLLREERERLEAQARKEEERIAGLKTAAAKRKAEDNAARLREEAALVPESVAIATSAPSLSASSVAGIWEGSIPLCDACQEAEKRRPDPKRECPHNKKKALQSILMRFDEWHDVITFKPAGMNSLARHYKDSLDIPGFKFELRDSFRSKGNRGR